MEKVYYLTGWTLKMGREFFRGDSKKTKLFSMRGLLLLFYIIKVNVVDYSCYILNIVYVKMSITWRRYAWVVNKYYTAHQRLNKEYLKNNKILFEQWLVGMIDGYGTFHIAYQNGKWNLVYKIALSRYNLLYKKTNLFWFC